MAGVIRSKRIHGDDHLIYIYIYIYFLMWVSNQLARNSINYTGFEVNDYIRFQ